MSTGTKSSSTYPGPLSPEYALLGLVGQTPAHGYELHQRLVSELGQIWHISQSQAYSILKRLEANGYLQGHLKMQEGLPDRREFHLTPAGRERFETWLHSPGGSSVRVIRVEFITRLYFASTLDPALTREIIDTQTDVIQSGLARMKYQLTSTSPSEVFNRLGLELRIHQLESILTWLDECRLTIFTNLQEGQTA